MNTIATIAGNSWSISIGGGWIILMLVGMGLCFVFMLGSMWLMHDGRGWTMCSGWWRRETLRQSVLSPEPPRSTGSEGSR